MKILNNFFFFVSFFLIKSVYLQKDLNVEKKNDNSKRTFFNSLDSSLYENLHPLFKTSKYQHNSNLIKILNLIRSNTNKDTTLNEFMHNAPNFKICLGCNFFISFMKKEFKDDKVEFEKFFHAVCETIKINGNDNGEFCDGFTYNFAPQLFFILQNTYLDEEHICAFLLTDCLDKNLYYKSPLHWEIPVSERPNSKHQVENNSEKHVRDLNESAAIFKRSDYPIYHYSDKQYNINTEEKSSYQQDVFEGAKFLHLSDLHLDLLYSTRAKSHCGKVLCCREAKYNKLGDQTRSLLSEPNGVYHANLYAENKSSRNESYKLAGYWGSFGLCDSPLRTIKHMFRHLSNYIQQIDYIIYSGDSVAHNIWSLSKEQVIETNSHITKLINKYFFNSQDHPKRFIPVIGNHESNVVNMFPPDNLKNTSFSMNWLYDHFYEQWKKFIPIDQVSNFKLGGYYSILIANNMKLIVLNTNACYRLNLWNLIDVKDPNNQLKWLEHELLLAEKLNQNVHLIGHLAPSKVSCNAMWLHNFMRIITRYQRVIKAQFYGHSHLDEIKIFYGELDNQLNLSNNLKRDDKNITNQYNLKNENILKDKNQFDYSQLITENKTQFSTDQNNTKMAKRTFSLTGHDPLLQFLDLHKASYLLSRMSSELTHKLTLESKITGGVYKDFWGKSYIKPTLYPISIAFLAPSGTTYDDVNPAYKVYIIEEEGSVLNGKTFYADIEIANRNHVINYYKPDHLINNSKRDYNLDEDDLIEADSQLDHRYYGFEGVTNSNYYKYPNKKKQAYQEYYNTDNYYKPKPYYESTNQNYNQKYYKDNYYNQYEAYKQNNTKYEKTNKYYQEPKRYLYANKYYTANNQNNYEAKGYYYPESKNYQFSPYSYSSSQKDSNYYKQKIDLNSYKPESEQNYNKQQNEKNYYKPESDQNYYKQQNEKNYYNQEKIQNYYKQQVDKNYYKQDKDQYYNTQEKEKIYYKPDENYYKPQIEINKYQKIDYSDKSINKNYAPKKSNNLVYKENDNYYNSKRKNESLKYQYLGANYQNSYDLTKNKKTLLNSKNMIYNHKLQPFYLNSTGYTDKYKSTQKTYSKSNVNYNYFNMPNYLANNKENLANKYSEFLPPKNLAKNTYPNIYLNQYKKSDQPEKNTNERQLYNPVIQNKFPQNSAYLTNKNFYSYPAISNSYQNANNNYYKQKTSKYYKPNNLKYYKQNSNNLKYYNQNLQKNYYPYEQKENQDFSLHNKVKYSNEDKKNEIIKFKKEQEELKWSLLYDMISEYSLTQQTPIEWANLIKLMKTNDILFNKYYMNLHRRSTAKRWQIHCNALCKQHLLDDIIVIDSLVY